MDAYPPDKAIDTDTADVDIYSTQRDMWQDLDQDAWMDLIRELQGSRGRIERRTKIYPVTTAGRVMLRNPIGWSFKEADKSSSMKTLGPPGTVSM